MTYHAYSNLSTAIDAKRQNASVWADGDIILINQYSNNNISNGDTSVVESDMGVYRYFSAILEEPGLIPAHPYGPGLGAVTAVTRLDGWLPGEDPTVSRGWTHIGVAPYSITLDGNVTTLSADDASTGYLRIKSSYTLTSADTHTMLIMPYPTAGPKSGGGSYCVPYLAAWIDATNVSYSTCYFPNEGNGGARTFLYMYDAGTAANATFHGWSAGKSVWHATTSGWHCGVTTERWFRDPSTAYAVADATLQAVADVQVGIAASTVKFYTRGLGVYRLTMAS